MSRHRPEAEFGSDSFLDVLANSVGIIIILIVLAATNQRVTIKLPTASVAAPPPEPVVIIRQDVADLGPDEPPPSVAEQLATLGVEIGALKSQSDDVDAKVATAEEALAALRAKLGSNQKDLEQNKQKLGSNRLELSSLKASLLQSRNDLKGVLAEFEVASQTKPNVVELEHKVTPISQLIEGPELHFRLAGNKVSVIPLEDLVGRVKTSIERQKDWLARHRKLEGSVGPIDGYSLKYLVQSRSLTPLEELRHGQGVFRITMGLWEVVPESDLQPETAEKALRRGSKFTRAIEQADPNAALTFWVYPDSFALFRKLQSEAHKAGFVVTGRPLPEGMPIAGSPNGTRSAGQ